jgi:hypothetical protein
MARANSARGKQMPDSRQQLLNQAPNSQWFDCFDSPLNIQYSSGEKKICA